MTEVTEEAAAPAESGRRSRRGLPDGFTVELGDDFSRNQTIGTLGGLRCHGQFSLTRLHNRKLPNGDRLGGRSVGEGMSQMPDRPGVRVSLFFKKRAVRIFDPLRDPENEAQFKAINRAYAKAIQSTAGPEMERQEETRQSLTEHQLKTLARELFLKCEADEARLVEGELPTMEQIDALDGDYLFDPSNQGRHPKFEKDVPDWEASLDRDF